MLLIGGRLNTSRPKVLEAIQARDRDFVIIEALRQYNAGINAISVNAAMLLDREPEGLAWLVEVVQEAVPLDICIDSSSPQALKVASKNCKRPLIINSISGDMTRYNEIIPLIHEFGARVVAMAANEGGIIGTAEGRFQAAMKLLERLQQDRVDLANVHLDPLVYPVSVAPDSVIVALRAIELLKAEGVACHFAVGLGNVSFGLPLRRRINEAFLILSLVKGVDTFILDPLDNVLMELLNAYKVLTMQDPGGVEYLASSRKPGALPQTVDM